jgi:hypothetical protein
MGRRVRREEQRPRRHVEGAALNAFLGRNHIAALLLSSANEGDKLILFSSIFSNSKQAVV